MRSILSIVAVCACFGVASLMSWASDDPAVQKCPRGLKGPTVPGCPGHNPFEQSHQEEGELSGQGPTASGGNTGSAPAAVRSVKSSSAKKTKIKEPPFDWVEFETREGTWMHLDVSPDGKQIVFDLLGDLYLLPIQGGRAKRLTKGQAFDVHPRWSPDGKSILFTSDRSGGNDAWILDLKTRKMRQVTNTRWISSNMAIWTPDGQYVVHRKRITDRRSVGVVQLWKYHIWGGRGVQLTNSKRIPDANDPAFSPNGRYLYFASRGRHRYNRNPHQGIWTIQRLDLQTQKRLVISRNASCPTPSPDGKTLAIVRRVGKKTAILLHDLRSGAERMLVDNLDRDQHEGFAVNGTYPSFRWISKGREIVYAAKGHFWKVNVQTKKTTPIRFVAKVRQKVTRALRLTNRINQKHFYPKILRWIKLHPGGKFLVWNALGQVYVADWPKLKSPTRLLKGKSLHYAPSFSRDGTWMTYVTWSDTKRGHVWLRPFRANGTVGASRKITKVPGYYSNPSLSPDKKHLVYVRGSGTESRGYPSGWQTWLQVVHVDLVTQKQNVVVTLRNRGMLGRMPHPQFSQDSQRIYFSRRRNKGIRGYSVLSSVRLDGTQERKHLSIYAAEDMIVSPDEKWLMFQQLHQVFVVVLPAGRAKPMTLGIPNGSLGGSRLPVMRLSTTGGYWPQWGPNSLLTWSLGNSFYTLPWSQVTAEFERKASLRGQKKKKKAKKRKAKKKAAKQPTSKPAKAAKAAKKVKKKAAKKKKLRLTPKVTKVLLKTPVARADTCLVLQHLRVVTMKGKEVLENAAVSIANGVIMKVGPVDKVPVNRGCRAISMKGMTATPGFVDTHAHLHYKTLQIYPENNWEHFANLAYGVTTVFDPSAPTKFVFAVGERIRAGRTVGPRVYSTGFILYGAENTHKAHIRNLKHAREHLKRMKALGALGVKSYMQPTRKQRKWVMQAAREEGVLVMPEGGGNLSMNLTMILDGHTGIEHCLPTTPLYRDVVQLFARSKTGNTLTLLVSYGGISGETFFLQSRPIWNDPKLKQFFPPRLLASRGRRTNIHVHDNDWNHTRVARSANKIVKAGGQVQIGSHGQLQGLGYFWEMYALRHGGMSNHHVLRAATLHGARYLGLHRDLGSIEAGKLADIAIFRKNPLKKLSHVESIRWVMQSGFLYDARSMNRVHPTPSPRPKFPWHTK